MTKHHQNWAAPFNEAKSQADARRQAAHNEAQQQHRKSVAAARKRHAAERRQADPDAQYHRQVRELKALNDELDSAIRAADEAYHAEVARLGQEHGVTVG